MDESESEVDERKARRTGQMEGNGWMHGRMDEHI